MHSVRRANTSVLYYFGLDGCAKENGIHAGNITAIGYLNHLGAQYEITTTEARYLRLRFCYPCGVTLDIAF